MSTDASSFPKTPDEVKGPSIEGVDSFNCFADRRCIYSTRGLSAEKSLSRTGLLTFIFKTLHTAKYWSLVESSRRVGKLRSASRASFLLRYRWNPWKRYWKRSSLLSPAREGTSEFSCQSRLNPEIEKTSLEREFGMRLTSNVTIPVESPPFELVHGYRRGWSVSEIDSAWKNLSKMYDTVSPCNALFSR